MRTRRAYVVAVAAWVLVVAVGSTLVWAVISRAGEGVVSGAEAAPTLGVPQPTRPTHGASSRRPAPTSSAPSGSASTGGRTTAPATQSPSVPATPAPTTPSTTPPTTAPTAPPPTTQQAAASRRTWQGRAGVVVSECSGSSIRLVGAYPNTGWSVQVEDRGPQRLAVHFEGNDDQGETELGARCVQGSPAYDTSGDG